MRRPQFTLRALLVLMLAVACFFGGIRFERERRRRADEAANAEMAPLYPPDHVIVDADYWPQFTAAREAAAPD